MANDKDSVKNHVNALSSSGLNAKSITGVDVFVHGSVNVVQIMFSGGQQFIKFRQSEAEVGGTVEWGTGTKLF